MIGGIIPDSPILSSRKSSLLQPLKYLPYQSDVANNLAWQGQGFYLRVYVSLFMWTLKTARAKQCFRCEVH